MKVTAEKVGSRVYLRSPWSPEMPDRCKSLGGRWNKNAKAWTYPLDIETCRRMRAEFGDDLNIGPELWAWAKAEVEKETVLHKVGGVSDMDVMAQIELKRVKELNPGMWAAMLNRPYQPVASLYVATARQCLVADQPGVGKTIEVLGGLIEAGKEGAVLVLAPLKSTQAVWEPEIHRWMKDYKHGYSVVRVSGLPRASKKLEAALQLHREYVEDNPKGLHFLVANAEMARVKVVGACPQGICNGAEDWCPAYDEHKAKSEMAHPWLFLKPGTKTVRKHWPAIIADETHQWLINTRGKSASQVGHGFAKLRSEDDNFRVAMTGTPLKGKKQNLFGTLNWLRPDVYSSKWKWIERYFGVTENDYGGRVIGAMNKSEEAAFFRALKSIMIRRTKKELRAANPKWMPPDKVYHDVWLELGPKQRNIYKKMSLSAEVKLASGTLRANGQLAEMTRLKQFAGACGDYDGERFVPELPSAKFDWLIEFLDERGIERKASHKQRFGDLSDDVQKVVVASQFTSQLEVYSEELTRLGIRHTMITGRTKDTRHEMNMFQTNDSYRLCLINTKAGGVSITLDAADDIVLFDETWVPDEQEQVEDRVHRASDVVHQVDVWYVRSLGTIEEDIAAAVELKAESNHVVLDASRGLAYARSLAEK